MTDKVVEAMRQGKFVIVTDSAERENEADLIVAAEFATAENITFMLQHTSGILCIPLLPERCAQLGLPLMSERSTSLHGVKFTVSVDAVQGTTTGVSATDRAATIAKLIDPRAVPSDFAKPGHVFPLRTEPEGVLKRAGHTEAALDLARLAGIYPAAVLGELMDHDGTMMRGKSLESFAQQNGIPIISIDTIIALRRARNITRLSTAKLPTRFGAFTLHAYGDMKGETHLALICDPVTSHPLVRLHSECLTGDNLFSIRCDCGPQLEKAMQQIGREGGILLYLRQEGRGIGLANKLRAYAVQDAGFDTVEANEQLGLPADDREYSIAAEILRALGVKAVRLLTNNPEKVKGLEAGGIIVERVPLQPIAPEQTKPYLRVKQQKLGHLLEVE